jgi:hypothetical protein
MNTQETVMMVQQLLSRYSLDVGCDAQLFSPTFHDEERKMQNDFVPLLDAQKEERKI